MVIRDADGRVINIGPWDHGWQWMADGDDPPTLVETNPPPPGAWEDDTAVVSGWDGGLYATDDIRRLGPVES